jgi:4-aminobutyrate aminotransferase / (S)-3-amino-2-methylpropionate transaminase / 5-aminovalerate transaminase
MTVTIAESNRPLEELAAADVPILQTEIPGPRSRAIYAREEKHSSPGLSALATLSGVAMKEGRGALVRDEDGNVFIDFSSGTVVTVTGHSHPRVVGGLQEQLENFIHIYDYSSEVRADFFDYLASLLPETLNHFQLYSGGAETVEAALRLARSYTKRHEFIGLYRAFHGKTLGAMSLMGGSFKKGFGPLASGFFLTPNAYCYRCPLGLTYPSCRVACADFITQVFEQESTGDVAAVVVEAIQGAGGIIVPPPEFLPKIADFCKRNGILLYVDEILTSAGRTGKMWAIEHYEVQPDIMTLGKGVGSGFPLGVVASTEEIMKIWPWDQPNAGSTTFGGSPLSAAAGLLTLKTIVEERLVENAATVGTYMKDRFREMQSRRPSIGDVRGEGMLIGVEFVRDRATKSPIGAAECQALYQEIVRRGLLVASAGQVVRVTPPLVLTMELADRGLQIFEDAVAAFETRCGIA